MVYFYIRLDVDSDRARSIMIHHLFQADFFVNFLPSEIHEFLGEDLVCSLM